MKLQIHFEDFKRICYYLETHNNRAIIQLLQGRKPVYQNASESLRGGYHCFLASAFSRLGDYAQADDHFNRALGAVPRSHKIKLEMVESYLQRGNLGEAKAALLELLENKVLDYHGVGRRFYLNMGRYSKVTGDYATALECYTKAQDLSTKNYQAPSKDMRLMVTFLHAANERTKRVKGALEYAYHLLNIDKNASPPTELAVVFLRNSMVYLKEPDEKVEYLATLSQISRQFDSLREAFDYNAQALALAPHHPRSLAARIRMLFQEGRNNEALQHYQDDKEFILQCPRATLSLIKSLISVRHGHIAEELANQLLTKDLEDDIKESTLNLLENIATMRNFEHNTAIPNTSP